MELDMKERLVIHGLLPAKGNYTTMRILQRLSEVLPPSEEEVKDWKIVENNGMINWDPKADTKKEIMITPGAKKIIIEQLMELDKKEELNAMHISLYEKFIGTTDIEE